MFWRSGSTSNGKRSGSAEGSVDTGWLVRDDQVLASVEVAVGRVAKARGLLGRDSLDGALVIAGRRSVHSFSMGFELDVAFLDKNMVVIRTLRLRRNRATLPVMQARWVLEAEAGAFGHWELKVGDVLEIRSGCSTSERESVTDPESQ